jgi:hypothetical protein
MKDNLSPELRKALEQYCSALAEKLRARWKHANNPETATMMYFEEPKKGQIWIRIAQLGTQQSVHSFVNVQTGGVHKAGGWVGVQRNAKGEVAPERYNLLNPESLAELLKDCEFSGGYLYADFQREKVSPSPFHFYRAQATVTMLDKEFVFDECRASATKYPFAIITYGTKIGDVPFAWLGWYEDARTQQNILRSIQNPYKYGRISGESSEEFDWKILNPHKGLAVRCKKIKEEEYKAWRESQREKQETDQPLTKGN